MSDNNPKENIVLSKITHSVRASQAVLQYGVGSMVDFPDQTLMPAAPEYWKSQTVPIHDERLEKALCVDGFGMPGNMDKFDEGISYVRFPEWYFCPKCREFKPINQWVKEFNDKASSSLVESKPYMVKYMKCPKCHLDLIVTRIVCVCKNGHIDDFPWVKWVHCQNYGGHKSICSNPKLKFMTKTSSSEGLDAIEIVCETCGARASLRGAMKEGIFNELDEKTDNRYDFTCTGRHPWKHSEEACGEYPKAQLRGSSSVYFPVTESSLVIPPYSNLLTTKVENSVEFVRCKDAIAGVLNTEGIDQATKNSIKKSMIDSYSKQIALEIFASEEKVKEILIRKWLSPDNEEESTKSIKYKAEEYEALSGKISIPSEEHGDFLRESTIASDYKIPFVSNVSLIHKIREVQALIGFSRLKPAENGPDGTGGNVVSIKGKYDNWYPAYQVRGEGIFIEFDQDAIDTWISDNEFVAKRVKILNEKYNESFLGRNKPRTISGKFLLLHTLSHLLIKQLSFECGYSIASIKERIYCSEEGDGERMAGILIYTASGDSEGTLGGLVRQGRHDTLPYVFKKAIESATTCSNDPVCSLSQGQGRDSLNLAACYSCTLIPETSCEEFNIFLDRGMVIGTFEDIYAGIYSHCVYDENGWEISESVKSVVQQKYDNTKKVIAQIIPSEGVDMKTASYADVWHDIAQWGNDSEKSLFREFEKNADKFYGKEMPIQDCEFFITGKEEKYVSDLLWKSSKVMLFTEENKEDYKAAKESGWKCFLLLEETFTIDELLNVLKEK